ncbi:MAG: hypothetical protein U0527_07265 [Candidatus Eisenbacteria bacterium]
MVEQLHVRSGEPLCDPPPRVVREYKLTSDAGAIRGRRGGDFTLRDEHVAMLELIERLGDGVVERLEIRHGLPCLLVVAGVPSLNSKHGGWR